MRIATRSLLRGMLILAAWLTVPACGGGGGGGGGPSPQLDATFGGTGLTGHDNAAGGGADDAGYSIVTDSSGRILVTGLSTNASGDIDLAVWRFNPDGSLDPTFGGTGFVTHGSAAGGNGADRGYSVTIDPAGRIVVAGSSTNLAGNLDMTTWRYNADGTQDAAFGGAGFVVHNGAAGGNGADRGYSVTIDAVGRIVVVGSSTNLAGNLDMTTWRYNADGTLDAAFGGAGFVVHDGAAGGSDADEGRSVTLDAAGRILVAGWSTNATPNSDMVIWRYNADGTLDSTFGGTGFFVHDNAAGGNGADEGHSITLDPSDRIVVAGLSTNASINRSMTIWRCNADGTFETGFGGTGFVTHDGGTGGTGLVWGDSVVLDATGRILVAGTDLLGVTTGVGTSLLMWRYLGDGTLDSSFGNGGVVTFGSGVPGYTGGYGSAIIIDVTDRILVTGWSANTVGTFDLDMVIWRFR